MNLLQMYKGKAFSPPTTLTNNIGAADTVIDVYDISVFPPAPNLATIGIDEEGETILYNAIVGNSLSGCQRGIEGSAKTWASDTMIARNNTAKDLNDIIKNIDIISTSIDDIENDIDDIENKVENAQSTADAAIPKKSIANNLTTEAAEYVLDARQGKILTDIVIPTAINSHNDNPLSHPDKVLSVYDSGGVRTLTNVASKRITGTGIIMITLPEGTPDVFLTVKVSGNNAATSAVWDLMIGGISGAAGWFSRSALLISATKIIDKVKHGVIGGKRCFLLTPSKELNALISIETGLNDNSATLPREGWSIDLIPDESGLTNIVETPVEFAGIQSIVWTPSIYANITQGSPTYQVKRGTGQIIDKLHRIQTFIQLTSKGGMEGAVSIEGVPFVPPYTLDYVPVVFTPNNKILNANEFIFARIYSYMPRIDLFLGNKSTGAIRPIDGTEFADNTILNIEYEWQGE